MEKNSPGRFLDNAFIRRTRAILPPEGHFADSSLYQKLTGPSIKDEAEADAIYEQADADIRRNWRVNPTFFDPIWTIYNNGRLDTNDFNPVADIVGYFLTDPMLECLTEAPDNHTLMNKMNFFDCSSLFFWNVAHALAKLASGNHLFVEFNLESITSFGRSILDNPEKRKEMSSPLKYHRISLSNVPDYIGMISIFTEISPLLLEPSQSVPTFLQANVLLHTGIWKDYAHYIFSATGIPTLEDAERFLGFRNLTPNDCFINQNQWTWSERGMKGTASKDEFTKWLHRLFLLTILPPKRDSSARCMEMCTTNIATFMRVCIHCIEVLEYPQHWVGTILDELLSSCSSKEHFIKTTARIPGESPVIFHPETNTRKVDISSFAVEIQSQILLWTQRHSSILIPTGPIAEPQDKVYKYRLNLASSGIYVTSNGMSFFLLKGKAYPMVLGFMLTKKLIFSNNKRVVDVRDLALREGSKACHLFSCMIFQCNLFNQKENSMIFYMTERSFERLKRHYVTLIRTDAWCSIGTNVDGSAPQLASAEKIGVV